MARLSSCCVAFFALLCLQAVLGAPTGCLNPMKTLSYRLGEGGQQLRDEHHQKQQQQQQQQW
jgi:hypothetical protein